MPISDKATCVFESKSSREFQREFRCRRRCHIYRPRQNEGLDMMPNTMTLSLVSICCAFIEY